MKPCSTVPDRPFRAKLRELGLLSREQEVGLPQFLMLAADFDGARRLARTLQRHPRCALPDALGTWFFSSRHQWCDLDWYVRTLGHALHLVRGEWTPSYCLVPVKTIRLIQEMLPQLKIVFLLRDPAVEAWHAWQETQQAGASPGPIRGTGPGTWPWARADFLGQLRRWKSVFPADQFSIGFEEQFLSEPVTFVAGLCAFLGIEPAQPNLRDNFRRAEQTAISQSELALLREACRPRIEELVEFLQTEFGQIAPGHWTASAVAQFDSDRVAQLAQTFSSVARLEFDDVFLFRAVQYDEGRYDARDSCGREPAPSVPIQVPQTSDNRIAGITAEKPAGRVRGCEVPRLVREGYRGFNIVAFRQEFIAIPQAAGEVDLTRMSDAALDQRTTAKEFLRADTLAGSERAIDEHLATSSQLEKEHGHVAAPSDSGTSEWGSEPIPCFQLVSMPHGDEESPKSAA